MLATVIVPTHDHGPLLRLAVRSALRQTVEDLEVLVIGDGATEVSGDPEEQVRLLLARGQVGEEFAQPGVAGDGAGQGFVGGRDTGGLATGEGEVLGADRRRPSHGCHPCHPCHERHSGTSWTSRPRGAAHCPA